MHLDALPLMDLLHGLPDPPPGKDLGLAPPPCMPDPLPHACHQQIHGGEGEEGASGFAPPLLRSLEGEGGRAA